MCVLDVNKMLQLSLFSSSFRHIPPHEAPPPSVMTFLPTEAGVGTIAGQLKLAVCLCWPVLLKPVLRISKAGMSTL